NVEHSSGVSTSRSTRKPCKSNRNRSSMLTVVTVPSRSSSQRAQAFCSESVVEQRLQLLEGRHRGSAADESPQGIRILDAAECGLGTGGNRPKARLKDVYEDTLKRLLLPFAPCRLLQSSQFG